MNKMLVTEAFSDIYDLVHENSIIDKNINYVLSKKYRYDKESGFDVKAMQDRVMDKLNYTNKAKEEFNSNMALILNTYKNKYLVIRYLMAGNMSKITDDLKESKLIITDEIADKVTEHGCRIITVNDIIINICIKELAKYIASDYKDDRIIAVEVSIADFLDFIIKNFKKKDFSDKFIMRYKGAITSYEYHILRSVYNEYRGEFQVFNVTAKLMDEIR